MLIKGPSPGFNQALQTWKEQKHMSISHPGRTTGAIVHFKKSAVF